MSTEKNKPSYEKSNNNMIIAIFISKYFKWLKTTCEPAIHWKTNPILIEYLW